MKRHAHSAVVALIAALAVMSAVASGAAAAPIAVTTQVDTIEGGACSLRAAIIAANSDHPIAGCPAGSGTDQVTLPAGDYLLTIPIGPPDDETTGDLNIESNLIIEGSGAGSTTIDGGGIDRVFRVGNGAAATIEGVTITGGHAPDGFPGENAPAGPNGSAVGDSGYAGADGGGILDEGSLTLSGDVVRGNRAGNGGAGGNAADGAPGTEGPYTCEGGGSEGGDGGVGGSGGGIATRNGYLTLESTAVIGNEAGSGGYGGDASDGGPGVNAGCSEVAGIGGTTTGGIGGAGGAGGGIETTGTTGVLSGTDCSVIGNEAGAGGAAGREGSGGIGAVGTNTSGRGGNADGGDGGEGGPGGGIAATLDVNLSGCTIASNAAGAGGAGGAGHYGAGGTSGPQIGGRGGNAYGGAGGSGGAGGGLEFVSEGVATIDDSLFASNSAGAGGPGGAAGAAGFGGYGVGAGEAAESGAASGGEGGRGGYGAAVADESNAVGSTISDSTVTANRGLAGGPGGAGGSSPGATMAASATGGSGGDAGGPAIWSFKGPLDLIHVTADGSSAGAAGAGGAGGTSTAAHAAGTAGAPASAGGVGGKINLTATIVADNEGGECGPGVHGEIAALSFPDLTCPGTVADPKLAPLADNGGPTQSQALEPGSAARAAIPFASGLCVGSDQRGVARPAGEPCAIGAYQGVSPAALTGAATGVSETSATVAGSVTVDGPSASVSFEYGTRSSYGSTSAPQALGAGVAPTPVSAALDGLTPDTVYHYRVVARTPDGTSDGADATFRTAAAAAGGGQSRGAPFGGLKIVGQAVKLTAKGVAPIKASCPAGTAGGCTGTLTLTAKVKTVKRVTVHGKTKLVRKTKTTHLGSVRFDVHPGAVATLEVKLSRATLPRVRDAGKLKATATAVATDGSGDAETTHATLTLERHSRPDKSKRRKP